MGESLDHQGGRVHQRTGDGGGFPSVSLPPLVFFSTTTGDAWILDAEDNLALQLVAAKTRLPAAITETPERFAIEWPGTFRIDAEAMIFTEKAGRVRTIVGYTTEEISEALARARA